MKVINVENRLYLDITLLCDCGQHMSICIDGILEDGDVHGLASVVCSGCNKEFLVDTYGSGIGACSAI